MPPDAIDVNVHPTKLEVRFAESGRLYSQLLGTLRSRFLTSDLTTRLAPSRHEEDESQAADNENTQRVREDFVRWAKGELEQAVATTATPTAEPSQQRFELPYEPSPARLELQRIERPWPAREETKPANVTLAEAVDEPVTDTFDDDAPAASPSAGAMQIHNRYLITENEEGVVVIDQHALHERILYEQLREKVLAGEMETQKLLVPEPVHLSPAECAAAIEHQELFGQLGIELEEFGGDSVLVSSYPAMLANFAPAEAIRELVEKLLAGGKSPDRRDVLDELLHMISCKAAIKAGDRLSSEEIHALLELRDVYQDSHHCPHGRPTSLVFTREELDRRFKRI